ncbi:MAG TPA: DUF2938 domain-containing protein [Chloroflexota bacterium]|nr:DUF2938 domain-containing protein [Chloroflexota bacterium]HUM67857.1 DUF2938 domain-containing protein [Chloroflexota bacterium]
MNDLVYSFISSIFIGLGATLTFDLWALFLKHAFKVPSSNICLVGRWLRYMPEGTFKHSNIVSAPQKSAECRVGWIAHYLIGVMFAITFVALAGKNWLQHPTLVPAMLFGVVTVVGPFFIMQPSFGLGFAASKTSNPMQARFRSLMNHTAFGIGLYLFGLLVSRNIYFS